MTISPRAARSARKSGSYCPEAGDLIWLDFDPQKGCEQAGRSPAIVLSPALYNRKRTVCVVCPVTSQVKGYPFEVMLPESTGLRGVVLSDQVKNLSWIERHATFAGKAPLEVLDEIKAKIRALLQM